MGVEFTKYGDKLAIVVFIDDDMYDILFVRISNF